MHHLETYKKDLEHVKLEVECFVVVEVQSLGLAMQVEKHI